MATLAEAVDAAETDWLVSADIPDTVDYLTVESEVVQVTATFPAQYQARDGTTSDPRIRVVRAAGGTTAASHADATALTPLIPPSAGGGAAEAGTVVVTPGEETDIAAALESATAPSAANPYATEGAVGDIGPVQVITRTLTAAEILTLNTSPVTLVAGQAGKIFWPINGIGIYYPGAVGFDPGAGGDFLVGSPFEDNGGGWLKLAVIGVAEAVEDVVLPILAEFATLVIADLSGAPLQIGIIGANPIAGDGTLDVTVIYRFVDVS